MSSACQNMYFWRGLFILEKLVASHLKHYVESTLLQHGGRTLGFDEELQIAKRKQYYLLYQDAFDV